MLIGQYSDVNDWIIRYLFKVDINECIVIEPLELGKYVHKVLENRHTEPGDMLGQTLLDIIPAYNKAEDKQCFDNVEVIPATVDKVTGEITHSAIITNFMIVIDNQIGDDTGVDYKVKKARHWTQEEADNSLQFTIYSWLTGLRKWRIWSISPGADQLAVAIDTVRNAETDKYAKSKTAQAIKTRDLAVMSMLNIIKNNPVL